MQISLPVQYAEVTQAAAATVKSGRAQLYGVVVTSSTTGTLTIYDNTAASGTSIFSALSVTTGQVITFGGAAIEMKNGIHVVLGGTCDAKILYI